MRTPLKLALALGLVAVLALTWWLASPLFLDRAVDEGLPPTATETNAEEENDDVMEEVAEETNNSTAEEETDRSEQDTQIFAGMFMDGEKDYETSGSVLTIDAEDGTYLRFEDFETTNGPDLFVYLIEPGMPTSEGINLGKLKGNTGNQNYLLPEDIDLTRYSRVVIWCRAFDADFGTGDLLVQN